MPRDARSRGRRVGGPDAPSCRRLRRRRPPRPVRPRPRPRPRGGLGTCRSIASSARSASTPSPSAIRRPPWRRGRWPRDGCGRCLGGLSLRAAHGVPRSGPVRRRAGDRAAGRPWPAGTGRAGRLGRAGRRPGRSDAWRDVPPSSRPGAARRPEGGDPHGRGRLPCPTGPRARWTGTAHRRTRSSSRRTRSGTPARSRTGHNSAARNDRRSGAMRRRGAEMRTFVTSSSARAAGCPPRRRRARDGSHPVRRSRHRAHALRGNGTTAFVEPLGLASAARHGRCVQGRPASAVLGRRVGERGRRALQVVVARRRRHVERIRCRRPLAPVA